MLSAVVHTFAAAARQRSIGLSNERAVCRALTRAGHALTLVQITVAAGLPYACARGAVERLVDRKTLAVTRVEGAPSRVRLFFFVVNTLAGASLPAPSGSVSPP